MSIVLKHYIVFECNKLIFNFKTKKQMDEWLVDGIEFVNEHDGEINKCMCNTGVIGYCKC